MARHGTLPRGASAALAAIGAIAAARAPAHAGEPDGLAGDGPGDGIAWTAPAGCPDADAVRARVTAHLGRAIRNGEVEAALRVTRARARWRVAITVRTADAVGERALEAGSCAELAESAALILAMTIDPLAGAGGAADAGDDAAAAARLVAPAPDLAGADVLDDVALIDLGEPSRVTDGEVPPLPSLTRRHVDDSDELPPAPRDLGVRARALVGGDLGSLPGAAVGWGAALEVAFGAWSIDLGVERFGEQTARLAPMPERGAAVDLTSMFARGCYTDGPERWRAGGCAGGEVALMRSTGIGFEEPFSGTTPGGGVHGGVVAAVRLVGPIALRADVSTTWMVVRPVLVEGGTGRVVHDPNVLVWRGFAGVEAAFP